MLSFSRSCLLVILASLLAGCVSDSPGPLADSASPPAAAQQPEPAHGQPLDLSGTITFDQVQQAVLRQHPELAALRHERRAREGDARQAGLWPNPRLGAEYEDFAGSGDLDGTDAAETTVMLSQEIPLAGSLRKRTDAARLAAETVDWDLHERAITLLGEARLAFAKVAANQRLLALRRENEALVGRLVNGVNQRVESGDVSPVERTKARVEQSTARIARNRAERDLMTARAQLAALWGAPLPDFDGVKPARVETVDVPALETLQSWLRAHPRLQRWTHEQALLQAELAVARADAWPAVEVGAGVRQFNETDDHAFLVEIGVPLPFFNRNQGAIDAATARLAKVQADRQAVWRRLNLELQHLRAGLDAQRQVVIELRDDLLPEAEATYEAVKTSYSAGQDGLLDLLDAERSVLDARSALIEAEAELLTLKAELEALLGVSLAHQSQENP